MGYELPSGIVKACAGIVESCITEPYITYIKQAEQVIGTNYAMTEKAQENREKLIMMVKFNLINRKEYDRETLNRHYGLKITEYELRKEKKLFCYELAKTLKLIKVHELSK